MSDETQIKINNIENDEVGANENPEIKETIESIFLGNDENERKNDDETIDQFDKAFKQTPQIIQDYILGEKLEKDIRMICEIEKIDSDKAKIIIENLIVSILVGLLPISEAKHTLLESLKTSNIKIEDNITEMILKDIDSYILSEIRKQLLSNKEKNNIEIRHITLKNKNDEKEKEELRKILLERTGTLSGKGSVLIQYKERENPVNNMSDKKTEIETEEKPKQEMNRATLLEKMNIKNISDSNMIKDRFVQIQKEEKLRLAREEAKRKEEEERLQRIRQIKNEKEKIIIEDSKIKKEEEIAEEELDLSKTFADTLKQKLSIHEDKRIDLNALREERGKKEIPTQQNNSDLYKYSMQTEEENNEILDPYREDI